MHLCRFCLLAIPSDPMVVMVVIQRRYAIYVEVGSVLRTKWVQHIVVATPGGYIKHRHCR